jgi:hypothetical protein
MDHRLSSEPRRLVRRIGYPRTMSATAAHVTDEENLARTPGKKDKPLR